MDGVVMQARIRQRVNTGTDGELQKREKGYWRTGKKRTGFSLTLVGPILTEGIVKEELAPADWRPRLK